MAVYGHEDTIRDLTSRDLPRALLFSGPPSVGKWTVAEYLRYRHRIDAADVLRVNFLSMAAARDVVTFASTAPQGHRKLVIIRMDRAQERAQSALLKTLEEAHTSVSFILISALTPLATILSRAQIYYFGLLTPEQVRDVLVERKKIKPEAASKAAALSHGRVQPALDTLEVQPERALVLQVVNAFVLRSPAALDAVASSWTDDATRLLITWCIEARSRQWHLFAEDEVENVRPAIPLRILKALTPDIRPKLVIRAALAAIIRES